MSSARRTLKVEPCDHCAEPIVWARTDHSRMPVDANPSERGNVLLRPGLLPEPRAHVLGSTAAAAGARDDGQDTYLHHAVSCPFAHAWNRRAAAAVVAATAVAHEGDVPLPLFELDGRGRPAC